MSSLPIMTFWKRLTVSRLSLFFFGGSLLIFLVISLYSFQNRFLQQTLPFRILIGLSILLGISVSLYLIFNGLRCTRTLFYETTFLNTATRRVRSLGAYQWWNEIIDHVFLSAQPQKNSNHYLKMKEAAKGRQIAVLTLLEAHELSGVGILNEAYTPEDWKKLGVEQCLIKTQDFMPLTQDSLITGVEFIARQIKEGKAVFVHCKAGRGRSAAIIVSYLLKYHQNKMTLSKESTLVSVEAAIDYVKSRRPSLSLNEEQKRSIVEFFNSF